MPSNASEKLKEIMEVKCASECWTQKDAQCMATSTDESLCLCLTSEQARWRAGRKRTEG